MHSYTVSTIQRPKKLQNSATALYKICFKNHSKKSHLCKVKIFVPKKVWKYDIVIYYIGS